MKLILLTLLLLPQISVAEPRDIIGQQIDALIQCESGGKQFAINKNEKHGASYGILQYRLSTFNEFGERYGLPHDDIFSETQQIAIAKRMLEEGRISNWKNCSKRI